MNRYASLLLVLTFTGAAQQALAGDGSVKPLNPGEAVGFNPQPDPPGVIGKNVALRKAGGEVMLNPQPEPPGITTLPKQVKAGGSKPGAAGQPAGK